MGGLRPPQCCFLTARETVSHGKCKVVASAGLAVAMASPIAFFPPSFPPSCPPFLFSGLRAEFVYLEMLDGCAQTPTAVHTEQLHFPWKRRDFSLLVGNTSSINGGSSYRSHGLTRGLQRGTKHSGKYERTNQRLLFTAICNLWERHTAPVEAISLVAWLAVYVDTCNT